LSIGEIRNCHKAGSVNLNRTLEGLVLDPGLAFSCLLHRYFVVVTFEGGDLMSSNSQELSPTEIERNTHVSVDNFHWISFRTTEMAERGP